MVRGVSVVPDIIAVLAEQKKHIHWFKSSEIEFEFEEDEED